MAMSEVSDSGARIVGALRRARRTVPWLLVFKGALAATLSWFLARDVLNAPSATFAPFSAVLMMQDTVSRSFDHALRYTAAMLGGIVLAGFAVPALGANWATFGLLVLLGLLVGRWRGLGAYGPQAAVAVMFAFTSLAQSDATTPDWFSLAAILEMVLLGSAIAVVVNLALFPPLR